MSNLVKYNYVAGEKRVIDSNELVNEKLEKLRRLLASEGGSGEFVPGINAETVEILEKSNEEVLEEAQEEAEQIVSDAQNEAEKIINDAKALAESIKEEAKNTGYEEGTKRGYEEGYSSAISEIDTMKSELVAEKEKMIKEYNKKIDEVEPMLVDVFIDIFSKVTHAISSDQKDMILHLVNTVMSKSEVSHEFLVKVSKEDYPFMAENKDRIYGAITRDIAIEIYEDPLLKRNECIIETDSGVFDCSLDIQLEGLTKDLKILASI